MSEMGVLSVPLEKFPPLTSDFCLGDTRRNITRYLVDFLKRQGGKNYSLPSIYDLSTYFYCHEFEVFDGLNDLLAHGYRVEIGDIDAPVTLYRIEVQQKNPGLLAQLMAKSSELLKAVHQWFAPRLPQNVRVLVNSHDSAAA